MLHERLNDSEHVPGNCNSAIKMTLLIKAGACVVFRNNAQSKDMTAWLFVDTIWVCVSQLDLFADCASVKT